MSQELEKHFFVVRASANRNCKKCHKKSVQGHLLIRKTTQSSTGGRKVETWYHVDCIFETFLTQRTSTTRIKTVDDLAGFDSLNKKEKELLVEKIKKCNSQLEEKNKPVKKKKSTAVSDDSYSVSSENSKDSPPKANRFRYFRSVLRKISETTTKEKKIKIIREYFTVKDFKLDDVILWCKLLIPCAFTPAFSKPSYFLPTKELADIFCQIFGIEKKAFDKELKKSSIEKTVSHFFESRKDRQSKCKPAEYSTLRLDEVYDFLLLLPQIKDRPQIIQHFTTFIKGCNVNDLDILICLLTGNLKMNLDMEQFCEALHPNAFEHLKSGKDLTEIVQALLTPKPESPKRKRVEIIAKDEDNIPAKKSKVPNYFQNCRLQLEEGVRERHNEAVQSFLAFGGAVVKAHEYESATHVLHLRDTVSAPTMAASKTARHIIVEWIKHSIEKKAVQDVRPYMVRLRPSLKM